MDASSARRLFDDNAGTYDRVNSVISLGLDSRWYDWAASRAVVAPGARVLDAFAGTGAVGLRAAALGAEVTLADVSRKMLARATERAGRQGLELRTSTADLASTQLHVPGAPFDAVVVMWGLRYVDDPVVVMRNLAGLLGSEGRLVVVEFVDPPKHGIAAFYFFSVLPALAGLLAHRRELYGELARSTRRMGPPGRVLNMIEEAGLVVTETRHMGFGLVLGAVAEPVGSSAPSPGP